MNAAKVLWELVKGNVWKVLLVFVLSGSLGVLGLVPGTENLSNYIGTKIAGVKTSLGTTGEPTIVQ